MFNTIIHNDTVYVQKVPSAVYCVYVPLNRRLFSPRQRDNSKAAAGSQFEEATALKYLYSCDSCGILGVEKLQTRSTPSAKLSGQIQPYSKPSNFWRRIA